MWISVKYLFYDSKLNENDSWFNDERGPAKKAGSVSLVRRAAFFWLEFLCYFLFSRKESKNQRPGLGDRRKRKLIASMIYRTTVIRKLAD